MIEKKIIVTHYMIGFHRVFVIIRSHIKNQYNITLLKEVQNYVLKIEENNITSFDVFRKNILYIVKSDSESYELFDNALKINESNLVSDNIDEIIKYLSVISKVLLEICNQLNNNNFERAYDLIDAIHCLPELLISKNNWKAKRFWKNFINPYRVKWSKDFLRTEEKEIMVKGRLFLK